MNKKEFVDALKKGLGRAYLYIKENGDHEIQNILKENILHDFTYDPQCNRNSKWFFSLLEMTSDISVYENYLLENLESINDFWDCNHAFELLECFAEKGSKKSKEALYTQFDKQQFAETWMGGESIINLDGLEGFLHVAERIGRRFEEDENFCEDDIILNNLIKRFGEEKVNTFIQMKKENSYYLKLYLEKIIKHDSSPGLKKEKINNNFREKYPMQKILDSIKNNDKEGGYYLYSRFGEYANDKELAHIYKLLKEESRKSYIIKYLYIFSKRKIPDIFDSLLDYAVDSDPLLTSATIKVLSKINDVRIRTLALSCLKKDDWQNLSSGLLLLSSNYKEGDHNHIEKQLDSFQANCDDDHIHAITMSLLEICNQNLSSDLKNILLWIYENTPCRSCREKAVNYLIQMNELDKDIQDECRFDANDDIVKKVKQI